MLKWKLKDGTIKETLAPIGQNLLSIAHANKIEMEGACGGVCACSTCHVILEDDIYNSLPAAKEEEEGMLDLAVGLTDTSRLGCQVIVTKEFHNRIIEMPKATRNMYVDGHVPTPH